MFPSEGFNAPTRFKADVYDCEVWGEIPDGLPDAVPLPQPGLRQALKTI